MTSRSRRSLVRSAALLSVLASVLAAARSRGTAAPAPSDDWPQFRGNPALTGVARSTLPDAPKLLWTYEAGESVESSAAIVGGTVYVGSQGAGLVALGLDDGKRRWQYAVEPGIGESSPAVAGGLVYVGDLGGTLHAVDARTGKRAWTYKTEGEIKSSPVVVGDRVLIGSYDGHLHAVAARTGRPLWKFKTQGPVHATPAVAGGVAYVAGCDEQFRGVRIADGKEVLQLTSGAYTGASPALSGGSAYYGTFDSEVLAVDLRARRVSWRYKDAARQFPYYSSAALADGRVVVGGRDKRVHAVDARTGAAAWTFATQARVESSPAVVGTRVLWAPATAASTPSTSPAGRACGSSTRAARFRPHRRWPRAGW